MREPRLLYVEDDPDIRETLATALAREGYGVTAVGSAEEGLAELVRTPHDLLLTDYQLPGEDGGWLVRSAVAAGLLKLSSAIVLTGHDRLVGLEGCVVLAKPIELDLLLAVLARALETRASSRPPAPTSRAPLVVLHLYVTGHAPSSARALRHVRGAIARCASDQIELVVHDVARISEDPAIAEGLENHRVVVTPTLVRVHPAPRIWMAGDLAGSDVVAELIRDASAQPQTPIEADRHARRDETGPIGAEP